MPGRGGELYPGVQTGRGEGQEGHHGCELHSFLSEMLSGDEKGASKPGPASRFPLLTPAFSQWWLPGETEGDGVSAEAKWEGSHAESAVAAGRRKASACLAPASQHPPCARIGGVGGPLMPPVDLTRRP